MQGGPKVETLKRTWSGGIVGKILIGCGGPIILSCICAIPFSMVAVLTDDLDTTTTAGSLLAELPIETPIVAGVFTCVCIVLIVVYLNLRQKFKSLRLKLEGEVTSLEQLVEQLKQDALEASRDEWFRSLRNTNYRNQIEVEVKFIYPLLHVLGYESNSYQVRVPVAVQVRRQEA